MPDTGFTHVALPVGDLDESIAFYAKYARMQVVHRRRQSGDENLGVAWLSDLTRPFVLVLSEGMAGADRPLDPFAHLGVACESREEVDRLCAEARNEGRLRRGPTDSGPPVGYWAFIADPDGHNLEVAFGQEVGLTVAEAKDAKAT